MLHVAIFRDGKPVDPSWAACARAYSLCKLWLGGNLERKNDEKDSRLNSALDTFFPHFVKSKALIIGAAEAILTNRKNLFFQLTDLQLIWVHQAVSLY